MVAPEEIRVHERGVPRGVRFPVRLLTPARPRGAWSQTLATSQPTLTR